MYATAFSILRNSDDASDAVQDAISALWQKHEAIAVPDDPQAFCNRTVRNTCIDRIRLYSGRYFSNIDGLYTAPADSAADSEASYGSTRACITDILAKFKDKHRKILALNIFSQLSYDEISSVTGESIVNVRAVISRGRKKIKEYLNHEL